MPRKDYDWLDTNTWPILIGWTTEIDIHDSSSVDVEGASDLDKLCWKIPLHRCSLLEMLIQSIRHNFYKNGALGEEGYFPALECNLEARTDHVGKFPMHPFNVGNANSIDQTSFLPQRWFGGKFCFPQHFESKIVAYSQGIANTPTFSLSCIHRRANVSQTHQTNSLN